MFSPDGKTIAFTSMMGRFQICTVPVQGGAATPLIEGEDAPPYKNGHAEQVDPRRGLY